MAADFLYRGGVIMPGLNIIEEACQEKLPALPSVKRKIPGTWPGKSTKESLQWGITGSYIFAIEEMLRRYRKSFGAYNLVATGGGAGEVAKLLRPATEVKVRPSLVFEGMKEFMEDHLQ
jgi:pantothenate kinase type III